MVLNSYKGVNPFLVSQLLLFNRSRLQCCSLSALLTWPLWSAATWFVSQHKSPNGAFHIICQASEPENIEMWAWIRSCLMQWLSKLWIFHMWKKSDVEFVVETNSEIIAASQKLFLGLSCSNFHLIAALKSQSQTSSLTSCDINGWSWHKETGKSVAPGFWQKWVNICSLNTGLISCIWSNWWQLHTKNTVHLKVNQQLH